MTASDIFYPGLVLCVVLLLGGLAAFGVTSWLFRMTDGRLRQCPSCKAKGAGYITQTETLETFTNTEYRRRVAHHVTHESLEDHYECEQCGHTWVIAFTRTTRERQSLQKRKGTFF